MKFAIALLATLGSAALNLTAGNVPVHIEPTTEATRIGELEALSLAVPAQWPENENAKANWSPVYYRGVFEVYVPNNALAKDLSVKPGSKYFLQPDESGPFLAIATSQDKTDILGVDTWFTQMQLETIVVGYIQDASMNASTPESNLSAQSATNSSTPSATAVSELAGRLVKAGLVGRNRTGLLHKIVGVNGKPLAFVDFSEVPERIQVDDYLGIQVRVSGFLKQSESGSDVIITAKNISKAN